MVEKDVTLILTVKKKTHLLEITSCIYLELTSILYNLKDNNC